MQVHSSQITAAFGSKLAEHLPLCYHSPHPHRQFSSQPFIASVWARNWTPKKCKIFTFHKTIYRSFNIHKNYFSLFVLKEGCFTKLFPLVGRCRLNGLEVMAVFVQVYHFCPKLGKKVKFGYLHSNGSKILKNDFFSKIFR